MKLTVLMLLLFFQVQANGYSQTVTLNLKNETLFNAMKEITIQAGIVFTYHGNVDRTSKPVTIHVKDIPWLMAVEKCLAGQDLLYRFFDKEKTAIIIYKKEPSQLNTVSDDDGEVKGRILNEKGEPMSGATIQVKSTGKGTHSTPTGEFVLKNVAIGDVITISYTGYATETVRYDGKKIEVSLSKAVTTLDKVVVQAYGETSQRLITGNISTVSAQEIAKQPVPNVLQAIQGRVPGLVVTQTNGYAGSPFKLEIHGRSSINPNMTSEPLIILDGVPLTVLSFGYDSYATGSKGFTPTQIRGPGGGLSPLYALNPDDIESVTVLKDADATAIYGSRGATGVILINTKKGAMGGPKLELSGSMGAAFVPKFYDLMNTQEYLETRREALRNDNITPDITNAFDLLKWDTTRYTNWQKEAWGKPATTLNFQLGLSGGDRFNTYRMSASYRQGKSVGNLSGSDQKGTFSLNYDRTSTNRRFNFAFRGTYSILKSDIIAMTSSAVLLPPNAPPIFDKAGNLNYAGYTPGEFPFASMLQPYEVKSKFLNSNLHLEYKVTKEFTVLTDFGYSTNDTRNQALTPIKSQNPLENPKGSSAFSDNTGFRTIIEPQLKYRSFLGKGELTVLLGGTYNTIFQRSVVMGGEGYTNDNLLSYLGAAANTNAFNNEGSYKYLGVFTRLNYNISDKYLFNLSARRDGSSRFGRGKQFGNFGAAGVAWIFTKEPFLESKLKFLSFGKIRSSYGITGSDAIGDYRYLTRWGTRAPYMGNPSYWPQQHANPDLQWQEDKKFEVGLELGFLKDRIITNFIWYQNRIGNQLLQFVLPSQTGFYDVTTNLPAVVQNRGIELSLNAKIYDSKTFQWQVNANYYKNNNILFKYPGLESSPYKYMFVVGEPLSIKKVLNFEGIDPATGQYAFTDKNKDGVITYNFGEPGSNDDASVVKNLSVKGEGGFGSSVSYKGFAVSFQFHFKIQEGGSLVANSDMPGAIQNTGRQFMKRWQQPGDQRPYGKYATYRTEDFQMFQFSTGAYSDASFLRLNNVSLSYDLPTTLLKRMNLSGFRLFVQGQNLFVIHNYDGIDPEAQGFGQLPPMTFVTGGLQVSL